MSVALVYLATNSSWQLHPESDLSRSLNECFLRLKALAPPWKFLQATVISAVLEVVELQDVNEAPVQEPSWISRDLFPKLDFSS